MLNLIKRWFFTPIDASFLAVFRIMFGGLLLFESVNYGIFLCLDCMFRESSMLFKYQYFEWVTLLPGKGLELNFLIMGVSAIGVMLGLYYRVAIVLCTLCLGYLFLLEQAHYLNHFYLAILFSSILIFLPAHRYWSLDARRNASLASALVPAWSRLWLVAQLEIVLIYAGLVKVNYDWLNLEPMRLWMTSKSHDAHPIFQMLTQDAGIATASYGVILLHLLGAPLLLWRKTRLFVFLLYCVFHTINAFVFDIGIFPWMTIAATLVLFSPDWPRQFYAWLRRKTYKKKAFSSTGQSSTPAKSTAIVLFISVWLLLQIVIPLRHWTMPGDVAWNEAGHRFSWRMKLRDKRGKATFYVVRNGAPAIIVDPKTDLNYRQLAVMPCIPDLIWQYAQFLDQQYVEQPDDDVKVYVDANCSLNTREPAPLVNRLIDISAIPRSEPVDNWILPNNKRLPKKFIPL